MWRVSRSLFMCNVFNFVTANQIPVGQSCITTAYLQVRTHTYLVGVYRINVMDMVMKMMEKYGNNLEEMVEERTQELVEEKKKTDRLLYRMLPS